MKAEITVTIEYPNKGCGTQLARIDLSEYNKQIREEVIEEFANNMRFTCSARECYFGRDCHDCIYNTISKSKVKEIIEQLKENK